MKIAINATFLNNRPTGVGNFTIQIAYGLSHIDNETLVIGPYNIYGCKIYRCPSSIAGSKSLMNNLCRFIYINSRLPYLLSKYDVDVLYCPILEFPFGSFSSRLVVSIHDLHPIYFPEQFGLSSLYFRCALQVLQKKRTKMVVVPSQFVKGELLKFSGLKESQIRVVYNGYDRKRYYPRDPSGKRDFLRSWRLGEGYILFVGSLFEYKNLKTLVSAFMRIKGEIPYLLVVIGNREVSREPLPQDDRIVYLDYVDHELLPLFYSYAEVFVHPALFEGFGLAVVEAMACGTPVVSSRGGSLPEVCRDAAILFEPTDIDALTDALLEVLGNKGLREELVFKGLSNVEDFSWEKASQYIYNICHELFEGQE